MTGLVLRTNGQSASIVFPQLSGTKPYLPLCQSRGGPRAKRGCSRCAMAPISCPTGWPCSAARRHTRQLGLWCFWLSATSSPWGSYGAHAASCAAFRLVLRRLQAPPSAVRPMWATRRDLDLLQRSLACVPMWRLLRVFMRIVAVGSPRPLRERMEIRRC